MPRRKRFSFKFQDKIKRVMREFKQGKLYSSSGHRVVNPKQAKAIALSEARRAVRRRRSRRVA